MNFVCIYQSHAFPERVHVIGVMEVVGLYARRVGIPRAAQRQAAHATRPDQDWVQRERALAHLHRQRTIYLPVPVVGYTWTWGK